MVRCVAYRLQSLKITKLHSLNHNSHILVNAAHLAYLTCLCCALNARELTRVKGVERMSKLLIQAMLTVTNRTERTHPNLVISSHILHSLAGLAGKSKSSERERASRNGSTVVDISTKPPSFKLVSLPSPCSPLF